MRKLGELAADRLTQLDMHGYIPNKESVTIFLRQVAATYARQRITEMGKLPPDDDL